MKRSLFTGNSITLALVFMLLTSACASGGASENHKIIVAGSTSIQPYMEILAEEYERLYEDHAVDVQGGGSSAGVTAAASHTADIGMSSRSLNGEEKEIVTETVIAKDGLAVIVHPANIVDGLTMEQIRGIYTHEITNWAEVGGSDANIHVITREEGSGTRSAFEELVMRYQYINPRSIVQNTNGSVRQLVSEDENAIGYISLGLVEGAGGLKPVKALRIDGVLATAENVINMTYKLFRPFLIVTGNNDEVTEDISLFIDFILSPEGQAVLVAEGLISILSA